MVYQNIVPWTISLISLIIAWLSFSHNKDKDKTDLLKEDDQKFDGIEKGLIKANMKLDQVCSTTTETRADIKSLYADLKSVDTRVIVLERDMKTAFTAIAELKEKVNREN